MVPVTIQHKFELVLQHHRAGRFSEAEGLYREILAQEPNHFRAIHYLGLIANQVGQRDIAVDLIRRAISLKPDYVEAHGNLGSVLNDLGRIDEAIAVFRQAIMLRFNFPEAHTNLGNALKAKGRVKESIAAHEQAISLEPNYAEAYNNLGSVLQDDGQIEKAVAAFRQAIALKVDFPEAHSNLGNALKEQGRIDEAIASHHKAISLNPDLPEAYNNLASALIAKGRPDESIAASRQAIRLRSSYGEAHSNLGNALKAKGHLNEAISAYRQAIALKPDCAEAHYNLGIALKDSSQLDEAVAVYRQAISLNPNLPEAHNNLGEALKEMGRLDEAIAAYRQAVAVGPNLPNVHSNLVLALHYHPNCDDRAISEELRRWNRQHAEPLREHIHPHSNDRDPNRRLRIGYLSPDFRNHVVGQNLLPVIQHHDRAEFEIICYANVPTPDEMTRQFQQSADDWRDIAGVSDEDVAEQIRRDQIDILVDLALHTDGNRLLVFARKPAPVQVSYLGYCGSTGLNAMDYRLSDPFLDPASTEVDSYSEITVRLPRTYWCYQPGSTPIPEVRSSPAKGNGWVTFGCQNNYCKISSAAWNVWTTILQAQPKSRLLIYCPRGSHRNLAHKTLVDRGIDPDRLIFSESRGAEYFQRYCEIDIALDPFPFGGGTTTCDALFMGVPVVTLSGITAVGRGGRSILSNVGLPELVAHTQDQYVRIALELANNLDRLETLRRGMRDRMLSSPLMDEAGFARELDMAYRGMWRKWCEAVSADRKI